MRDVFSMIGQHRLVPRHTGARQFIKFALVGVMNTVIDLSVYAICIFWFDLHYLIANAIAFLSAASNSYILNRRWTFRSEDPRWRRQATKYFLVLGIGFGINETLLYLFVEHGDLGKIVGKALAIVVVLFWNFGVNKLWTFSKPGSTQLPTPK